MASSASTTPTGVGPRTAVYPSGTTGFMSQVSWGAVIAGAIVAVAIGLMLNALGAGIGATTVDVSGGTSPSASSFGIGAAIWVLLSNLIGLAVGGYVAARLSGTSDNTDGTLHGLTVWGTTFLISAVLLGNLVAGVASTAARGASSIIGSAAQGAGSIVSTAGQQAANRTDNNTLQSLGQSALNRVQGALSGQGGDPAAMNSDQRKAEIGQLAGRRVTDGNLSQQDRDRLTRLVAAEYGISQQDAQQRVQQAETQATQTAQQAKDTAAKAADATATGTSTGAFAIFLSMLLGAIASVFGARRGTRDFLVRGTRTVA